MTDPSPRPQPPRWALALAFALVYTCWGTTYLAIRAGVQTLPPALFAGARILSAGLVLLGFLALRGAPLRLSRRAWVVTAVAGLLLFVGGNGLITVAEKTVESGVASVLACSTPLWIALIETAWPWGERLKGRGWLGLFVGLGGVLVLLGPALAESGALGRSPGLVLVLVSALVWSLGSVVLRHGRGAGSHLVSAAYQLVLGGAVLVVIGLVLGEPARLTRESFTPSAVFAFFYLLVVGSLLGFLAYTWLLQHVSAPLAGTYAYVNPVVAVLVGWLIGGETITGRTVMALGVILAGVALVRSGSGGPAQGAEVVPGREPAKGEPEAGQETPVESLA